MTGPSEHARPAPEGTLELKYYMFDWDDNILHMPTRIRLDRKTGGGWEPWDVSTAEFARIRRDTERYRPRDGDWDQAFIEFYDIGERGEDAFLDDTRKALAPIIRGEAKGAPSFEKFRRALIEGRLFAIITARSHSSRAIRKAVEYFIDTILTQDEKRRMIDNLKTYIERFEGGPTAKSDARILSDFLDLNRYHGVTSPEFEAKMGRSGSGSESPEFAKQIAIKDFVHHVIGLIRGAGIREPISVGFSDDDPHNVQAVEEYLREELSDEFPGIRFVVYDTSDPDLEKGRKIVIEDRPSP